MKREKRYLALPESPLRLFPPKLAGSVEKALEAVEENDRKCIRRKKVSGAHSHSYIYILNIYYIYIIYIYIIQNIGVGMKTCKKF